MATAENPRLSWWSKLSALRSRIFSLRDASAWLVSCVLHLTMLLAMASLALYAPIRARLAQSSVSIVELGEVPLPQEFHFSPEAHEQIGALSEGGVLAARASAPVEAVESHVSYDLAPMAPAAGGIEIQDLNRSILEGPNLPENVIIKGSGSVGTTGAAGAIDRITHEILLSLDERPTVVAWLFDQSGSLKPQRESIAKRFDRVYKELGVVEASGNAAFKQHGEKPLLTLISEFGNTINLLTPKPTAELPEIKAAVRAISDEANGGGRENVFQSVAFLADKLRHYRLSTPRRNVMIVIFTDEAGDDIQALDTTVDLCRKLEIPVYVIGVPAPFGRETAFVKWVDPDPKFDQSDQWAPVHQGPESMLPERLKLFFGGRAEEEEQLDSGFGPFGLSRLAYETGGLYFTVHPNRESGKRVERWESAAMSTYFSMFFDERIMRNYRPDYGSAKQYAAVLKSNRACAALVEASQLSSLTQMENVRLRFPRVDDGQFARELSEAQREAARLEPKIEALATILRQGERDRKKVTTPRWQAGFDLAIGRALAVKVRTEGYNAMLAAAKQGLKFKDPKNDTWELRSTAAVTISSALEKDAADAKKYLDCVLADHKGTPWAIDAERELRQPLGWEWKESFSDVASRIARAEANRNQPRPEQKPEPPKKPRRDPPPL